MVPQEVTELNPGWEISKTTLRRGCIPKPRLEDFETNDLKGVYNSNPGWEIEEQSYGSAQLQTPVGRLRNGPTRSHRVEPRLGDFEINDFMRVHNQTPVERLRNNPKGGAQPKP